MIKIDEFRKYLQIDKHALDDEVVRQPSLFFEVSEAYVEAAAERDSLKEQLAEVDAVLDKKYRKAGEKNTEGQIRAQIQTSQDHHDAFYSWLQAKETADKLAVLKDAFQQRGYMLRDLVSLHTSNYFETSAVRSTAQQDKTVYETRRARLAAARK